MAVMEKERASSRRTMLVRLGALLFGGFFLTSAISYWVSRQSIRQTILEAELPLSSDNIYSEIQRDLFKPILISSLMANDTFVKDWLKDGEKEPERIARYLRQIKQRYGMITSFLVSEATRNYYYADGILKVVQEDNPVDAWFFRVRQMETDYEINVDPDMANRDTMTIFINYRIVDREGRFLGATGVGLTVNAVKDLMRDYKARFGREIFFYSRDGELVLHSLEQEPDRRHSSEPAFLELLQRIERAEAEPGSISAVAGSGGLTNYRYIPELDWLLVVEQDSDRTRSILVRSFALNLVVCLFISVVVLGMIRFTILRYQQGLEVRNRRLQEQRDEMARQAEALADANAKLDALHREKDDFIGVIVHDLKNPLNAVIGLSESLLASGGQGGENRAVLADIHAGAVGVLDQVESLLQVSELDDRAEVSAGSCDLREICQRVVAYQRHAAERKNIRVECSMPSKGVQIRGGEKWVLSAVGNVLSNAIKFSPTGKRVSLRLECGPGGAAVEVADEGPGLSKADQARLFRKFERLGPRPTGGETSSGLGLYLVQQIMLKLGGGVSCRSRAGEGAVFRLDFQTV